MAVPELPSGMWELVAEQLSGAGAGSWRGVLRSVCRPAREGVNVAPAAPGDNQRMDPRVFTSRVELLKWASAQGCPLIDAEEVQRAAVGGGGLDVLLWGVRHRNWPLDQEKCEWAAERGQLAVLQWLRQKGCPWDEVVCRAAAEGGHLELLQWAIEQGLGEGAGVSLG
eukprot:jgi/Tetstr1/461631/TSEL_006731.t1